MADDERERDAVTAAILADEMAFLELRGEQTRRAGSERARY